MNAPQAREAALPARLARLRDELEDVKSGRYEHACGLDVHDPEAVCLSLCGSSLIDRLEDEIARIEALA